MSSALRDLLRSTLKSIPEAVEVLLCRSPAGDQDDERAALSTMSATGRSVTNLAGRPTIQLEELEARLAPWTVGSGPPTRIGVVPTSALAAASRTDAPNLHETFVRLLSDRKPVVVIDWPTPAGFGPATGTARLVYERACRFPLAELADRNRTVAAALTGLRVGRVVCPLGTSLTFTVEPGSLTVESCRLTAEETFVQIPGGEVFLRPVPGSAHGVVHIAAGRSTHAVEVTRGHANLNVVCSEWGCEPVVEIGVGTNVEAPPTSALTLGEKSGGAIHIGVGDARIVGGNGSRPDHFDLLVVAGRIQRIEVDAT